MTRRFLAILLFATASGRSQGTASFVICDITNAGVIAASDIQAEINEALGVASAADNLNGDGQVNAVDVQIVINAAMGMGCAASVATQAPAITGLSPASASAGGGGFLLTITGKNFLRNSAVQWNGGASQPAIQTAYVSSTQLTAIVSAAEIAIAGVASVTVVSPAPAGNSTAASFTITGNVSNTVSFVAPTGSDSNPGTISQPYLTIQKCATTVSAGGTCALRAGTYRETVTPNSGITITSYDGEPVTVDGSDPVTGWTLYQGSIYQAKAVLSTVNANQVFVGDQMMTEARWPNGTDLFSVNWATAQTGTTTSLLVDSNLPDINWTGAKIHLWSGTDPWDPQTGTITVSQPGQLTFTVDGASACPYICAAPGGNYYLFAILGALDTEQEWYYDPNAMMMYFWAPGGADPNTLTVNAKRRQYAFDLSNASNVTIENINLFASTVNTNGSSNNNVFNQISGQYLSHYTSLPDVPGYSSSYWYDHITDSGIVLSGSGNILQNSVIAYSAGNGVSISGSNNIVRNNLIHHTGYMGNYASGVTISYTGHTIENNTIHTSGRFAIFPSYNTPNDVEIGHNNLFDAMILSRDGGEIYVGYYTSVSGTSIDHNWFHDTQSHISGPADNYPLAGVYLDAAYGFLVDQNVFWNNEYDNIFLHGAGFTTPNDNNISNNTIPDVASNANILLDSIPTCGTTQVVDNLVLVPVSQTETGSPCPATDNTSTAPGANQMTATVQVGCNFAGCVSSGPPAISGGAVAASIALQPACATVSALQTATFTVTGAGSPPLSYQWARNGVNISGATSATYATAPTTSANNGDVFTVLVSNLLGSARSSPVTLTVN